MFAEPKFCFGSNKSVLWCKTKTCVVFYAQNMCCVFFGCCVFRRQNAIFCFKQQKHVLCFTHKTCVVFFHKTCVVFFHKTWVVFISIVQETKDKRHKHSPVSCHLHYYLVPVMHSTLLLLHPLYWILRPYPYLLSTPACLLSPRALILPLTLRFPPSSTITIDEGGSLRERGRIKAGGER